MSNLDLALAHAGNGWPVFPVQPNKRPYPGFTNWESRATTDAEQIATWWSLDHTDALVAIAPGTVGVTVIDIDRHEGKASGFDSLSSAGVEIPASAQVRTSVNGNGDHVYFAGASRSRNGVLESVDRKSVGGYIVAPYDLPPVSEIRTPLPAELAVSAETTTQNPYDGTVAEWLARCAPGPMSADVKYEADSIPVEGIDHGILLAKQLTFVNLAVAGAAGVPDALRKLRACYLSGQWDTPEYRTRFDSALLGAIQKYGAMPDRSETETTHESEDGDDSAETDAELAAEIHRATLRKKANREADRVLAEEDASGFEMPAIRPLGAFLNLQLPPADYIVDEVMPRNGNVMMVAHRKAGKTTMVGNLVRSLADGDEFMDFFATESIRKVTILDFEMSENRLQAWLRQQGIRNTAAVRVVSLRGKASAFNILSDRIRGLWAEELRGTDVLIVDPLAPIFSALGIEEKSGTGPFLQAFDALKNEAGISEGVLAHHTGWAGEHARGDSNLEGWPDAIWRLTTDDPNDPGSFHYFAAQGRDVDVHAGLVSMYGEKRLMYSPEADTGALKTERKVQLIVDAISARGGEATSGDIAGFGIPGVSKNSIAAILRSAVESGDLTERKEGPAKFYSVPLSNVTEGHFGRAA